VSASRSATADVRTVKPTFFKTADAFRKWLSAHHDTSAELLVGFYKKGSGKPTITYHEALDEALATGWIDGIRRSLDAVSYTIRFTPRQPNSYWSAVNTKRAKALIAAGRMQSSGLQAFEARDETRTRKNSFERESAALDRDLERQFRAAAAAWAFFQAQPPGYRRVATFMVVSAKKPETRARRLALLIRESAAGRRLSLLTKLTKS